MTDADTHHTAIRQTTAHGGQLRLYYEAVCSCRWEQGQRRVTRERATSDADKHLEKVGIGPIGDDNG